LFCVCYWYWWNHHGCGEVLKQNKPGVRIIGVEPANAAILSGGPVGNHQISGIGVRFVPDVLNRSILDEVIAVTDEEAFSCARRLAREEGIIAGVSSGAAAHAALLAAGRKETAGKIIVVSLADTGERYMTTSLFSSGREATDLNHLQEAQQRTAIPNPAEPAIDVSPSKSKSKKSI